MHCPLIHFCNCCLKICISKCKHKSVFSLVWAIACFKMCSGAPTQARKLCHTRYFRWSLSFTHWDLWIFFFSLALGYCFIFYTGGLFFYDLQPVNLNYFHKFFQRLFTRCIEDTPWSFDQAMLPTFECIEEMAPKSVLRFFCTEMF